MSVPTARGKMTVADVCKELDISSATLHRLRKAGKILPVPHSEYLERAAVLEFTPEEVERFKRERRAEIAAKRSAKP